MALERTTKVHFLVEYEYLKACSFTFLELYKIKVTSKARIIKQAFISSTSEALLIDSRHNKALERT